MGRSLPRSLVVLATVLISWVVFVVMAKLGLEIGVWAFGRAPHLDVATGMAVKLYGWVGYPLLAVAFSVATGVPGAGATTVWRIWVWALGAGAAVFLFLQGLGRPGWGSLVGLSTLVGLAVPNTLCAFLSTRARRSE